MKIFDAHNWLWINDLHATKGEESLKTVIFGLLGQAPSSRLAEGLMVSRYLRDGHLSSGAHAHAGTEWPVLRDAHTMRPRR